MLCYRDDWWINLNRAHFEQIAPVCPVCRARGLPDALLRLAHCYRGEGDFIEQGILHCSQSQCQCEFPIIDGIPILVHNPRELLSRNITTILERDDLHSGLESLLGDCCGPGSVWDTTRQHLSTYGWDHFGEFDPEEAQVSGSDDTCKPGTLVRLLQQGRQLLPVPLGNPLLDAGCGPGRTTWELASRGEGLVLGIDLHLGLLRLATRLLQRGEARYPRRRVGLVYDQRNLHLPPSLWKHRAHVDFWACDATALPMDAVMGGVVAMNLLDCVPTPTELLRSLRRVTIPGAPLLLGTPYDWSNSATPVESWLGGHSQRSPNAGASETILRELLSPQQQPHVIPGLQFTGEILNYPWTVRLHDRAQMRYSVHLFSALAIPLHQPSPTLSE